MLQVKRTTYVPSPNRNEEFAKLRTEIKQAIKKLVEDHQKILKNRDDYVKVIQQIKKEYQAISAEKNCIKKLLKQYENEREKGIYWQGTTMSTLLRKIVLQKNKKHVHYFSSDDELFDEDFELPKKRKKTK